VKIEIGITDSQGKEDWVAKELEGLSKIKGRSKIFYV
jgi:hypothetical protein